jgi:aminoglycoside 3-N-acetyltransferase
LVFLSEQNIIEKTKKMNTVDSINRELLKLGINKNDIILVHSSLSSIGWTCGGVQAVIMALLKSVGDSGTIVMPAHSGDISDPANWENPPVPKEWIDKIYESMPAFDVNITPTRGMGSIAELFRTLPNTKRSNHPQVSFSANGKYAEDVTKEHKLTPQFGINTPLGKMYELNAKVLLLGVGYDSCTSFHLAEILTNKMEKTKNGTVVMEDGNRVWKWFEDFEYDSDMDFQKLGEDFEKTGNVNIGMVGNATCKLFNMKTGVDFAKMWLLNNRFKDK